MSAMRTLTVDVRSGRTDVFIGDGVRATLETLADRILGCRRAALVIDANLASTWPDPDLGDLEVVLREVVPAGEAAKTRDVLATLQDRLLDLHRNDVVVAIGGGAVLDVAGFAAATTRRGLPWVAVATSVVAMADAAIGGKVAINHERGKNLLGTFHPPCEVCSDVSYLETLPERERIAGLAEVYKCGRLGAKPVLDVLAGGVPRTTEAWTNLVEACATLKGRIVESDERDYGERRRLNYGHTIGHALERVLGNETMRHGEAVAIGMVAATALASARGWVSGEAAAAEAAALAALGLPVAIPAAAVTDELLSALHDDKKRGSGQAHTFVLPRRKKIVIAEDVSTDEVRAAIEATR